MPKTSLAGQSFPLALLARLEHDPDNGNHASPDFAVVPEAFEWTTNQDAADVSVSE